MSKQGMVYLVGAGPGDYRLISLKGLEYIQRADTIVYDRLADDRLLAYARADVELVYVGKAASEHTLRQEEINDLLVAKAKEGKKVVRLKGGDPFVFGRGGEEALALVAAGIPWEVVPGVSSAIGVPAYAGIPVTHRGIATSFAVITGHEDPDKEGSTLHWDKLAQGADTLIFLMGVENIGRITTNLIKHGRSAATPAAIIRWGTKPQQEVWVTTLGAAPEEVASQGIKPPAIFLVGEVVSLRQKLAWFDERPLFGKQVLVTRARQQASSLTAALEELGAQCLEVPAIEILPPESLEPLDAAIRRLATYQWLIFTSVNGVEAFFSRLLVAGRDSRALAGCQVAAIGAPTAVKLKAMGVIADLVPAEFQAEGLLAGLENLLQPGMRILIPRAQEARDILPRELTGWGMVVEVVPAYRTVAGKMNQQEVTAKLAAGEMDLVTFTSSSTVTNLLELLGTQAKELLARTTVACIGPITAATCLKNGIKADVVAEEFTIAGLVAAIENHVKEGAP